MIWMIHILMVLMDQLLAFPRGHSAYLMNSIPLTELYALVARKVRMGPCLLADGRVFLGAAALGLRGAGRVFGHGVAFRWFGLLALIWRCRCSGSRAIKSGLSVGHLGAMGRQT